MRIAKYSHSMGPWPASQAVFSGRRACLSACGGVALLLGACGTRPGGSSGGSSGAGTEAIALGELRSRLERDFAGTPVQFEWGEATAAGPRPLRVTVPQPHGFDTGRSAVKPPLAALLDRMVDALRRNPRWSVQVFGPVDARAPAAQGADRAGAVRDYLVMKGVPPVRFSAGQRSGGPGTELVITER